MLGRDTEWRQGNLLTDEAAHALELVKVTGSSSRVVVISHDCDLPNDIEEFVEVIIGSLVEAPNPMLANARNPAGCKSSSLLRAVKNYTSSFTMQTVGR